MTATISRRRRKINSVMMKILSLVLVVLLLGEESLSNFGRASAEETILYLKEVRLFESGSMESARSVCEAQGYTFVNTDLNAGTTKNYVYLGYKTTTDRDEAIYKISLLDMNGGYQIKDYQTICDEYQKANYGTAQTLQMATMEFIDSYKSGSPRALDAYEGMNLLYIPEAGDMKFGDYVISGKTNDDFYAKILTQASSASVSAIINFLYAGLAPYDPETETEANGYNPDTWAAQMEDSALWGLVGSSRISKDEAAALDRQYADDANKLFKQMQAFATGVENAQATYDKQALINQSRNTSLDNIVESMDDIEESDTGAVYIESYNLLNQYSANSDMPLGEWIVEMGNMTSEEVDITQIYPMIDSMSNAQVRMTELAGFVPCASTLGTNESSGEYKEIVNTTRAKLRDLIGKDAINMWSSCDPELMSQGYVAYTNEAIRKSAAQATLSEGVNDLASNIFEDIETAFKWLGLAGSAITVGTFVFGDLMIGGLMLLIGKVAACAALVSAATTMVSVVSTIGAIGGIFGLVVLGATILYFVFREIWDWYWDEIADKEYEDIPHYVVDAVKVSKGYADVKYKVVTNQGGVPGDLNGHKGHRGWVAMYYSTDTRVGSPIRADDSGTIFRVAFGSADKPSDCDCANFFGQITPGNCNTNAEEDGVGGIYITYYTEKTLKNRAPAQNQPTTEKDKGTKTEDQKETKYYNAGLIVQTAKTEQKAKSKITVSEKENYIWDQNLSYNARTRWETGGQYTYIGYSITTDPDEAVRDIRVATFTPGGQVTFGEISYGCAGTLGYPATSTEEDKNYPKDLDGLFYTCDKRAGTPIEVGKLHLVDSFSKAQPGWEPVTTFSGAPYNFATTRYNSQGLYAYLPGRLGVYPFSYTGYCTGTHYTWDEADRYLYYEPEETYTGGDTKYLSGMFFAYGSDSEDTDAYVSETKAYFSQLTDKLKTFPNTTVMDNINLAEPYYYKGMYSEDEQKRLYICYTWSYNPYRAIYGMSVFQGPATSTSLPYNIQKAVSYQSTYSGTPSSYVSYTAASVIVQRSTQPDWVVRGISPENAFMCPTGLQGQNPQVQNFRTEERRGFFKNVGLSTRGWLPTGLYVSGFTTNKNPLTLADVVITTYAYTAEENEGILSVPITGVNTLAGTSAEGTFASVQDMKSPAEKEPFNFAYPTCWSDENDKTNAGTPLYIYYRNTVYMKKYISRVFVGQYSRKDAKTDDEDILKEFDKQVELGALVEATRQASDEVIPVSVTVDQKEAWYNREDSKHSHIDYKPAEDQPAAYLSVSRTDNPDEAIRAMMLFKASPDNAVPNQITVDGATYYCASNSSPIRMSNGSSYYLYYTYNIGASSGGPITSVSAGSYPFVSGRVTALMADRVDSSTSRAALKGDTTMKTFIWGAYEPAKNVYFNKIYAAYGSDEDAALLKLLEQGCTQYISMNLNQAAGGSAVYLGYRTFTLNEQAIRMKSGDEAKAAEREYQMNQAVYDIVCTVGEPYNPEGFLSEKYQIYYAPVVMVDPSDKTKSEGVNLNLGTTGPEIYMYYSTPYAAKEYNQRVRRDPKALLSSMPDQYYKSPLTKLALARYDRRPTDGRKVEVTTITTSPDGKELDSATSTTVTYGEDVNVTTGQTTTAEGNVVTTTTTVTTLPWEYVMKADSNQHIDLNDGAIKFDSSTLALDNRITMFAQREDGSVKPSAEVTGGYTYEYEDIGYIYAVR